jgi:hypothetical protein
MGTKGLSENNILKNKFFIKEQNEKNVLKTKRKIPIPFERLA